MNILAKRSIESEIKYVDSLLERAPENDVLGRLSLEGRLQSLKEKLAKFQQQEETAEHNPIEVILHFGGDPVVGKQSIELSFAADALNRFQDIISAVYANRESTLSEMGPMPFTKKSALTLTGMPRGSFGFRLQEKIDADRDVEPKLKEAIQEAASLLSGIITENPSEEIELQAMNGRVFTTLKNFIFCLSKNNASIEIETHSQKVSIMKEYVKSSYNFIKNISDVVSSEIHIRGIFKGAVAVKRRFDFVPDDKESYGENISGKISKHIDSTFINIMNTEYMDKPCVALFIETKTRKNDAAPPSTRWELLNIE